MSEHIQNPNFSKTTKRVTSAIAGAALVFGGVKYGPDVWEAINPIEESQIVAGVPGQVETYYSQRWVTAKPVMSGYHYWLGIEQCTADILAAEKGQTTQSFDPDIGELGPGCKFDWVKVSQETYSGATVGGSITFEGKTGEPVIK